LPKHLIFYRGPLERSRLSFIIESVQQEGVQLSFLWVFPGKLTEKKKEHALEFLKQYSFEHIVFRGESFSKWLETNIAFRKLMNLNDFRQVYLVGFSAPLFALYKGASKRIWFINGIPEEKEMQGVNLFHKLSAGLLWKLQGWAAKCSLVVTVSSRMSDYVIRRTRITNLFHAPTCVDLELFRPKEHTERKYFTYLGSGAAWQALDLLEAVWYEIHMQDPSVLFQVISRDERCRVLGQRIAKENIRFVSSPDFSEVAGFLHESQVGFLLRKDTIVNRVCFPTKLGEYLASGSWVVTSAIDWDVIDVFRNNEIGVLVNPTLQPKEIAKKVIEYSEKVNKGGSISLTILNASKKLERTFWIDQLRILILNINRNF
jgi:hypothetical protein